MNNEQKKNKLETNVNSTISEVIKEQLIKKQVK